MDIEATEIADCTRSYRNKSFWWWCW